MFIKKPGHSDAGNEIYARHASTAFNRRIHKILQDLCRELAGELAGKLYAIILGGNYGRGEGGTRIVPEGHGSGIWSIGEAPAEDIDLLIVSWFDLRGRREVIGDILSKYEAIFSVPIDLAPVITPLRLMFIPHRFNWRRLVGSARVLYGPPKLYRVLIQRYGRNLGRDPRLIWSLLLDQGLRLIDVIAREQGIAAEDSRDDPVIHQGKYFREIAQCILLATGRYQESIDLQLHEYIVLMDEDPPEFEHLRLLKNLLPKAISTLKLPEQGALDMPENWLFHLNLWLEAHSYICERIPKCTNPLMRHRMMLCRKRISEIASNQGRISARNRRSVRRLVRLLHWIRNHVFFI